MSGVDVAVMLAIVYAFTNGQLSVTVPFTSSWSLVAALFAESFASRLVPSMEAAGVPPGLAGTRFAVSCFQCSEPGTAPSRLKA